MKSIIAAAGLVAVAQAFTQPVQPPTYGSLLTPDLNTPVTAGQDYTITWAPTQPADGVTVSLVLCNGPSTNCVLQGSAVAENVPAGQGSYTWSVPCSLPEGTQATESGYGMLIIVDGTGEFQYSTQFSVKKGDSCSSSSTTTTTTTTATSSSSETTSYTSSSDSASSTTSEWYSWTTSGFNTTTVPAASSSTTVPVVHNTTTTAAASTTTSKAAVSTSSHAYSHASSSVLAATTEVAAAATSAVSKPYTGAAAVPAAFANVVGVVGVAALAMLAL